MERISLITTFILILSLINTYSANLCINLTESNYETIKPYEPIKIKIEPKKEACFKYNIVDKNNNFSLSFLKGNSYTVEVLLYNKYENIKINSDGNYIGFTVDPYIMALHSFQEIDASKFNDSVYIIIRETKSYYYSDYMKLYDSNINIELKNNEPITIKNFMSNGFYTFTFESTKNVVIEYSSKESQKKGILIYQNDDMMPYYDDFVKYYEPSYITTDKYKIYISILPDYLDDQTDKIEHKFTIVYYENDTSITELKEDEIKRINYLISSKNEILFNFNIKNEQYSEYNTINFELDYNNQINKYIEIKWSQNDKQNMLDEQSETINETDLRSYDIDSDEFYRIYFKPRKKYIHIQVIIKQSEGYKEPKYFKISYGKQLTTQEISKTSKFSIDALDYIPKYVKFQANDKNYLFYAPYEQYCTLIIGELVESGEINKNYLNETSDLHQIDKSKVITTRIFSKKRKVDFYFEEYIPENLIVNNFTDRIKDIYKLEFKDEDCKGQSKNIIFKYDIEAFSFGQNNFSNYWTTDGDMITYYKNNSEFKETFFAKEKLEKETIFESKTHIDIFTIKCNKPGIFYIRPYKKSFDYQTHDLNLNCINNIEINYGTEIVQLYSPIHDPPPHIYFSITTLSENKIEIIPDTEGLFNPIIIDSENRNFQVPIDTKKYKMDQMAIKLISNSSNEIELIETSDCESCTYQNIVNYKISYSLEINKTNFVIFLDDKITKIGISINNDKIEEIAYGLVDLASNDTKYIPTAFVFDSTKKEKLRELIEVSVDPNAKNIKKPFRALIFSMKAKDFKSFEADIYIYGNNNEIVFSYILAITLFISLALILSLLIAMIVKKCIRRNQYFDSEDSLI